MSYDERLATVERELEALRAGLRAMREQLSTPATRGEIDPFAAPRYMLLIQRYVVRSALTALLGDEDPELAGLVRNEDAVELADALAEAVEDGDDLRIHAALTRYNQARGRWG